MEYYTKNKVNLFIIGVKKCGTTFYRNVLGNHEKINAGKIKEPNFFLKGLVNEKQFGKGYEKSTHYNFLKDEDSYNNNFSINEDKQYEYLLDASISYIEFSEVAEKIIKYNNDAKIIIFIRHPVSRLYSQYQMDQNQESISKTIEESINLDYIKKNKKWGEDFFYVETSVYYEKIKKYLDVFGNDKVLIIPVDIIEEDQVILKLEKFLDLEIKIGSKLDRNKAVYPRSKFMNNLLCSTGLKKIIKNTVPKSVKDLCNKLYYVNGNVARNTQYTYKVDKEISNKFSKDIENLDKIIPEFKLMERWKL